MQLTNSYYYSSSKTIQVRHYIYIKNKLMKLIEIHTSFYRDKAITCYITIIII